MALNRDLAGPLDAVDLADHGPVIPVIVIHRLEEAVPLAQALVEGGIRVLEVTLRTAIALQAIEAIARSVPEAIVGAGTVRDGVDVLAAKEAGAQFVVSPGYLPEIAIACRASTMPLLPGVSTASEVMQANMEGLHFLKFFPAATAGGVPMLKALAGPFPDVSFCPTGGITEKTLPEFLALPNVLCCGGSWLTPQDAIEERDWSRITALARHSAAFRAIPNR